MSKPFYFITVSDSPEEDPHDIEGTEASLRKARKVRAQLQKEEDKTCGENTPFSYYRIFKVKEVS